MTETAPNLLHNDLVVMPSRCDSNCVLNTHSTLGLFEDISSEHALLLNIDEPTLIKESNAYWVISRTRIVFHERPRMFDKLSVETWPLHPESFKFYRCCSVEKDGRTVISSKTEWLILDMDTHHIRRTDSIHYPIIHHVEKDPLSEPFEKIRETFDENDFVREDVVQSTDIDMNHHTNNVSYCRGMMNLFSNDFAKTHNLKEIMIEYLAESFENDVLRCYMKTKGDTCFVELRRDDKAIVRARILFETL